MYAELVQTRSGSRACYQVVQDGGCRYSAEVGFPFTQINVAVWSGAGHICTLHSDMYADPVVPRGSDGVEQRKALQILGNNGEYLGQIFYHWIARTTPYFQIEYRGRVWTAYEVGLGRKGLKLPIYQGEKQVGLLEKPTKVKDNLDVYHLYALNDDAMFLTVLFGLYYDFKRYRNVGEFVSGKTASTMVFSLDKKVKAKYDPAFCERCRGFGDGES